MCGIVGRVTPYPEEGLDEMDFLDAAVTAIAHRGPDDSRTFYDQYVSFGHTRLSITDLSINGGQPMQSSCGNFIIIFNGEIYNYGELKKTAILRDLDFKSHSDTEVLLELFARCGVGCLGLLNGIFAFAIYDIKNKCVFLTRDRFGVKPLYFRSVDSIVYFSSEIKGINSLCRTNELCHDSLPEWSYYGCNYDDRTLYRGVKKIRPGHYLKIDITSGEISSDCYWRANDRSVSSVSYSEETLVNKTRDLLSLAVNRQLSDSVPFGVLLSGGVDSSAIAALSAQCSNKSFDAYTIVFSNCVDQDLYYARRVARHLGIGHHEVEINSRELVDAVCRMAHQHDQPFGDAANIPLYLAGRRMVPDLKVVLLGDGADELFCGYRRYATLKYQELWSKLAPIAKMVFTIAPNWGASYDRVSRYLNVVSESSDSMLIAMLSTSEEQARSPIKIFSSSVRALISEEDPFRSYKELNLKYQAYDLVNRMSLVDLSNLLPNVFLEKVDRAFMASGIEARVPFLDNDLASFALELPSKYKLKGTERKWILKRSLEGILPNDLIYRKKRGFGVPYGLWLTTSLKDLFFEQLDLISRGGSDFLDIGYIKWLYYEHENRMRDHSFILWKILSLTLWINKSDVNVA